MTTINYPKRLIEVDLPIKKISEHARREKSIRHGHISTLHIWWARRPLAACRAVICAALWPDPADPLCPESFKDEAKKQMEQFWNPTGTTPRNVENTLELRKSLLDFIADFANWDNASNQRYMNTARILTKTAHEAFGGEIGTRPLVVDPFAGGGAIPLEALRVGADAYASDLNPVAVLLNKVVLEYIPKYGKELAEEVRKYGMLINEEAEKELAQFYPKDPDGSLPIAYLWARTVRCEGPGCGAEIPLIRSLWLARKGNRSKALRLVPNMEKKRVDFEIIENAKPGNFKNGTVKRGSATCPVCGYTTPVVSVRAQLKVRHGGASDARLYCVVTTKSTEQGRFYRLPTKRDLDAVSNAREQLERHKLAWKGKLSLIPDEPYPDETGSGALSSSVLYGINAWGEVFTPRQQLSLSTLIEKVNNLEEIPYEKSEELKKSVQTCLGLIVDKVIQYNSSLCRWKVTGENLVDTFGRQALPMVMDFSEPNIFGKASGDFSSLLNWVIEMLESTVPIVKETNGIIEKSSATKNNLPNECAQAFITDPPYYDAIAYGDLSDFFFVWLKRSIGNVHPKLFYTPLVNKTEEIVHLSKRFRGPYSHKTKEYFENGMQLAMAEGYRIISPIGIGVVVFAHKSTAGWEAQLKAMIDANWIISASWPIDTEMGSRMNAMGTASLASSIHLVCRPREKSHGKLEIGDWQDVLAELPDRIREWMPRLKEENVVGADAIFACLGPALEIFSRYSRVERASGEQVTLNEYLEKVWEAVENEALKLIFEGADTSGFEEDARLTAMWLWTLKGGGNDNLLKEQVIEVEESEPDEDRISDKDEIENKKEKKPIKGYSLNYDDARKISQGLGAHLEAMPSLIEIMKGNARLISVAERSPSLFGKQELTPQRRLKKRDAQLTLFPDELVSEDSLSDSLFGKNVLIGKTSLDRVHQSMLLFGNGQGEDLKRFLVEEGVGKDQQFWKLAQALAALYPTGSDEKRWIEGVLARKKGLGL
jgi:putative DNA methylase